MANPFFIEPANPLSALMLGIQGYDRGQKYVKDRQLEDARNLAAQSLLSGGDPKSALAQLIRGGDVASANAIANFGNQTADQAYKTGMLEVARQNANRQEIPSDVQKLKAAGIAPGTPEAAKALFPRTDTPISATDKKAIFEAEDAQPQIAGTLDALRRAKDINSQIFQGLGSSTRAWLGTKLPDMMVPDFVADPKTAKLTEEWQKTMGPEALQTMASTLKGATTDFELRKFIEMLADPSTTADTRGKIIDRMIALSEKKQKLNDARIQDLRGGNYFKSGQNPTGNPGQGVTQPKQQQGADPIPGAKQAADGNFYIPDPSRPGKYLQVVQ